MADHGLDSLVLQLKKYYEFGYRVMRRWWIMAIATIVAMSASIGIALTLTRIYESRTLISWKEGVNQNRIFSQEESQQNREENWLESRIEQMVSSHTLLWKIAKDFDLYPKERRALAPEVILELLRKSIKFDTVGTDSFWFSFEYKDPAKAQQVAARLAAIFIEQNVGDRIKAALATQAFMESEVHKAKVQVNAIENDLAQFVSEHPEFQIDPATGLPRGDMGGQRSTTARPQYMSVRNPELREALKRKGQLEAQLQLMLNPQSDTRITQAKQELATAQQALASRRRRYTDQHPDVQRAIQYVKQMQVQLQSVISASRATTGNPNSIKEKIAEVDSIIARLSKTQVKVPTEKVKQKSVPQSKITNSALAEKQWYQLTRDREIFKAKYDQLQERLTKAKVAASMEKKRSETQFIIVDPANFPAKPLRPSRSKIAMAGTAFGGLVGFALAALLVLLDPRIYNEEDLRKVCDLPILAQIPKEK